MPQIPGRSPQTRAVLTVLLDDPTRWRHGYEIARTTGLKSGTLYPILIRLADRGLLDARWEDEQPAGRPRRHLYPTGTTRSPDHTGTPRDTGPPGSGGIMTKPLTRIANWTLDRASRRLPDDQRSWGEAVRAEADEVPPGPARLRWLLGGLWTVARVSGVPRGIALTVAAGAAGAALVRLDWHPGSANPAMPANRTAMIITVGVLAALPWVARTALGPVADNRAARSVRITGYLAVYLLLLVMVGLSRFAGSRFDHFQAFDQANWEADMRSGAVVGAIALIALVTAYAAIVLAATARRTAVRPGALAAGGAAGAVVAGLGYALMPLGNPLHPHNGWLAAGYLILLVAAPIAAVWGVARLRLGAAGGLLAGTTGAMLLAILTISTMLLLPRHVDLIWANPSPAVPHGTPFELRMSVGDAAVKYLVGLILGPVLGLIVGAAGRGAAIPDGATVVVAPSS
jgi:hypothetical protein